MELKAFNATHVSPGQPLTAQAWNEMVDAIDGVHDFVAATQHAVNVKIKNAGLPLGLVRVTAVRAGEPPVEAVVPIPPDDRHVLVGLLPGPWEVRAQAPGFVAGTKTVEVGENTPDVEIILEADGAFMPNLFGLPLATARSTLAAAAIPLSRLLDFTGRDLPPSNPGTELDNTLVLLQVPAAGTSVPRGGSAALVIAVPVVQESAVDVPSLAGLTLVEAKKALEGMGLVLGRVTTLSKNP